MTKTAVDAPRLPWIVATRRTPLRGCRLAAPGLARI
jgi:hypothetical protein